MFLNFPLAVEMRDPGILVCAADRAVDEVTDLGVMRSVDQSDSLLYLCVRALLIGGLHCKYAVHILKRSQKRLFVVVIAASDFHAGLVGQRPCPWLF